MAFSETLYGVNVAVSLAKSVRRWKRSALRAILGFDASYRNLCG
jgi:hypothetical protein